MSGSNILVDTNILIYILSGNKQVAEQVDGQTVFVSFVTEMELLGYTGVSPKAIKAIKNILHDCTIVDLNSQIKDSAINLKQKYHVKLPDAIIAATALYLDIPLFTADKAFKKIRDINCVIINV